MRIDGFVPVQDNDSAQTHLSQMFTAIISNLDTNSRKNLCHVLHHCHTRLSPQAHLPVMFFSERDDVTYKIAEPHLSEQHVSTDPPSSTLCHVSKHSWGSVQSAAVRVLNGACIRYSCTYTQEPQFQHQNEQPASLASPRQSDVYSEYAPLNETMNESDSDDADDFDDELSYDSYISDSKMSDITEDKVDCEGPIARGGLDNEVENYGLTEAQEFPKSHEQ